ncbi:meiosis initiator protein [Chroicocephalus ridibundus]|uniref:meiosis initiator protein n=1 Tax=Chroicocephalus ridibundus TaxID=1192867 RepID=UPI002FDEB346
MGTVGAQQGQRGSPRHPKKKCVNGFIMFCCLNRKAYMSQRARQFSRQHDRVVRLVGDKDGDGDTDPPAPLQLLLAAHAGTLGGGPSVPLMSPALSLPTHVGVPSPVLVPGPSLSLFASLSPSLSLPLSPSPPWPRSWWF